MTKLFNLSSVHKMMLAFVILAFIFTIMNLLVLKSITGKGKAGRFQFISNNDDQFNNAVIDTSSGVVWVFASFDGSSKRYTRILFERQGYPSALSAIRRSKSQ